uniref:ribonucleoside-triphosphate reductase (thioredoxin) n=1 Tax=Pithovirus LCPAC202 TaxID=2506592 RepID=A0A481Z5M1_9VIRU|nr:MAG: ribonucleotide reductase [Pithovirus LCPAC202]
MVGVRNNYDDKVSYGNTTNLKNPQKTSLQSDGKVSPENPRPLSDTTKPSTSEGKSCGVSLDHMIEKVDHVNHYYELSDQIKSEIYDIPTKFGYGTLSEIIFRRTYSRLKPPESGQSSQRRESWQDVTARCTEGCFTLIKNHMKINYLPWYDQDWEHHVRAMGTGMAKLNWTPPGRGLWGMGELAFKRGAFVLNNCGAASTEDFTKAITWTMDGLMCGCGVGFDTIYDGPVLKPNKDRTEVYQVPDTKGGWVESVRRLVAVYIPESGKEQIDLKFPIFDYSLIRPLGAPIKTFGGTSSGSVPLEKLHHRLEVFFDTYIDYQEALERKDSPDQRIEIFNRLVDRLVLTDFSEVNPIITEAKSLVSKSISEGKTGSDIANELIGHFIKLPLDRESPLYLLATLKCIPNDERSSALIDEKLDELNQILIGEKVDEMKDLIWNRRHEKTYDMTRLIVDCFNAVGACVVAGNVRRSSMLATSSPEKKTFFSLKDLSLNPEREKIAYMSNNSVEFTSTEQYNKYLPSCVEKTKINGEPGYFFRLNVERFGRIGRYQDQSGTTTRESEKDTASIPNPCSEIPLNPFELCNLAEIHINRFLIETPQPDETKFHLENVFDLDKFLEACHLATIYTKSVSLLPTHHSRTNAIIKKNHRIGVSITGGAQVHDSIGSTYLTSILRKGYNKVRKTDRWLSEKLGIRESIRVTTCKPSGTISLLTGSTPGIHFPHSRYCIRRVRVAAVSDFADLLKEEKVEWEKDVYTDNTLVFTFYIDHGNVRSVKDVSLYEQLTLLSTYQREWSDNMVSVTVTYDPETEAGQLEHAIAQFAPITKSCSFLPNIEGVYKQMPYQAITEKEYSEKHREYHIDWSKLDQNTEEPEIPRGCSNDTCEIKPK